MLARALSAGMIIGTITIVLLTTLSTPTTVGPVGILALFAAGYVTLIGLMTFLLHAISRAVVYMFRSVSFRRPLLPLRLQKAYYFSTVLALAPIMLIGMQSVGEIGLYEFSLVALFVIIGIIYISRKTI
ncbi:hypothetical protein B7Z28_01770 [Candidatus Saccharibacteria bacterium 32-45-3]|nr:MAG: hypothetical protein B7Z28_01770 [Candidatus Saccharibacteria bacterium 32-45-3]